MLVIPKLACPVGRASFSIVEMPDDLIAKMAVMVHDTLEWAIWLTGEKVENGRYHIDNYIIPKQKRAISTVDIEENIPDNSNIIGVIHSHHRMGAFFSGTDTTELNPLYPLSIVIATPGSKVREGYEGYRSYLRDVRLFGFNYLGVAEFELPCESIGEGGTFIVPYSRDTGQLYEGWDESLGLADHTQLPKQALHGCDKVSVVEINATFQSYDGTSCGIESQWKDGEAIFGWDEEIKNEFDKLKALTQSAFVSSIPQSTGNNNPLGSAWLFQTEPYRPQIHTMNVQSVELDTPSKWLYDLLATKLNKSNLRNCSVPKLAELLEAVTPVDETKLTLQFAKLFNIFKGNHKLLRDEEGLIIIILIGVFLETDMTVEDTVQWLNDPKLAMLFTSAILDAVNIP